MRQPTSTRQPVLPFQSGFYKNLHLLIHLIFIYLRREARVMRRIFAMFFGFGLGLVAMFLAFQMHVVKTDADWHFVRKQETQFADFYVGHPKMGPGRVGSAPGLPEGSGGSRQV